MCVLLYVIPQTTVLGAILENAPLGGAIASNIRIGNPLFSHELFGVYLGLISWCGLWLGEPSRLAPLPLRA